jgi:hypothetical protein
VVALSRPARPLRPRSTLRTTVLALAAGLLGPAGTSIAASGIGPGPAGSGGSADGPAPALQVAIGGPGPVVDPWTPFTLRAVVAGGIPPLEYLWLSPQLGTNRSSNWTVELGPAATATFLLEVADAASGFGSANLTVTVGAPLSLTASAPAEPIDTGGAVALTLGISGGVGPFAIAWAVPDGGGTGTASASDDGDLTVPIPINATGRAWVSVDLADQVGGTAQLSVGLPRAYSPPGLVLGDGSAAGEAAHPFRLVVELTGGAPPIAWRVDPLGPVTNATASNGTLDGPGAIAWTAVLSAAGNLTIGVTATDATGAVATATAVVPVVPAVADTLVPVPARPVNGTALLLSAAVGGGMAPYRYTVVLSDGEGASGALLSAGLVNVTVVPGSPGVLVVRFTATDALGGSTTTTLTLEVAADPVAPPAAGSGLGPGADDALAWLAGVAGLAAGGVGGYLLRHRRERSPPPPNAGTTDFSVLERLLAPTDGVDRESLEFLAEEEGVGADRLGELVDRAVRAGRVRRRVDGGEERLEWVPPRPASASGAGGGGEGAEGGP